ncbi:MAG: precorrin-8X methylmutase [Desulfovibrio sp.]|nr:precorrin-8X methylmutase [Desulfovibrio sp.]
MSQSGEQIEAASFAIIDALIPEPRPFHGALWQIARRCIHTVGDPTIISDLRFSEQALEQGLMALQEKCTVYTDTKMAKEGISAWRIGALGVRVEPLMDLPNLAERAKERAVTKASLGIEEIAPKLAGQIVVIGNAPTALLTLLEVLAAGAPQPALIVGMPVGFVQAAEAKERLAQSQYAHFTLLGRRGGSALAACCINALAELLLAKQ